MEVEDEVARVVGEMGEFVRKSEIGPVIEDFTFRLSRDEAGILMCK